MPDPILKLDFSPPSSTPFAGKVIAITGGGSGIGLATALLLYSRGATIAAAGIHADGVAELDEHLQEKSANALPGQKFSTTVLDVSKEAEVQVWVDDTLKRFGKIDGAANVAGVIHNYGPMAETTTFDFNQSFDTNTRGVYHSMRAMIPHLKPGSSIVNVSSISAQRTEPGISLYGASKAAINTLTTATASEYGPKGIRVNAVAPGVTLSARLLAVADQYIKPGVDVTALKRGGEPLEIAYPIAFLLSDEASFITGTVLRADGGALAIQYP